MTQVAYPRQLNAWKMPWFTVVEASAEPLCVLREYIITGRPMTHLATNVYIYVPSDAHRISEIQSLQTAALSRKILVYVLIAHFQVS